MPLEPPPADSCSTSAPGSSLKRATVPRCTPPCTVCVPTRACARAWAKGAARRSRSTPTWRGLRACLARWRPPAPRERAASVNFPMRRTIFMALVAALLLVPSAAHAAGPIQILRDCGDDGLLQGNYTASELRNARNELPTDIDEYSDCRDVLGRAIAAKTASAKDTDGDPQGAGTGAGGG